MTSAPPRILCVGTHHKTGTVWMRRVWRQIGEALSIPFLPLHNPAKWQKVPEAGRVIVANWAGAFAQELFDREDARFVHVIRDPRDVLLSGAHYHETNPGRQERFLHEAKAELAGRSYQQHLQALETVEEKLDFEMQNMHLKTLTEMLRWPYGHPRALELRYEDLIADEDCARFSEVLAFFGFTGDEAEVARRVYFDNSLFGGLKAEVAAGDAVGRTRTHVASGEARQWPAKLPKATAELYRARHGAALVTLGYERDAEDWLDQLAPPGAGVSAPLAQAAGGSMA